VIEPSPGVPPGARTRANMGSFLMLGTRSPTCARGGGWSAPLPSGLPSAVGVFGMAGGCGNDPDCAVVIVDHVADASAACDLVLPLFEVSTVVPVRCEISAEPVLALVVGAATRLGA
jgi:hypothetical protein